MFQISLIIKDYLTRISFVNKNLKSHLFIKKSHLKYK